MEERIITMQNRIRHLASNNEHIEKKTSWMEQKRENYLERRREKLKREEILKEQKQQRLEEIRRRNYEHNPFMIDKTKDRTPKTTKVIELARFKSGVQDEKKLLHDLNEKQTKFNHQKNQQKILMVKIDKAAKDAKKIEAERFKKKAAEKESRKMLIQRQNENERLKNMLEELETTEKMELEKFNKTLCNQNKTYQALRDVENRK